MKGIFSKKSKFTKRNYCMQKPSEPKLASTVILVCPNSEKDSKFEWKFLMGFFTRSPATLF